MTKERKLAIEMWQGIREMLSASDGQSPESIPRYKNMFCDNHGLHWKSNCWLCQYIPDCVKCPFASCGYGSYYGRVKNIRLNTDARIKACNAIINALGGRV